MANEITITGSISYDVGGVTVSKSFTSQYDKANAGEALSTQSVGFAAHEVLALGDVGTAGPFFLKNLDDTNYFELGHDATGTFVPHQKCGPGDFITCTPAAGVTYYVKANTAAVKISPIIPDVA